MPRDSQDDAAFDKDAILGLFKKAKTSGKAYPFAFGLAAKPQDCGFLPHLRKPGKTLKAELKGASKAVKKVCFGTFKLDGNEVLLTCPKPLKGIVRQLKIRFREEKMGKFKPVLVDANGNEIDEENLPDAEDYDDNDDAAAPETDGPAAAPPDDPAKALTARLAQIRSGLAAAPKPLADRLKPQFLAAVQRVQAGDVTGATEAIAALEAALSAGAAPEVASGPGDTPADGPDAGAAPSAASSTDDFRAIVARVGALPDDQKRAAMPKLQEIKRAIGAGDTAAARDALTSLSAQIDAGAAGEPGPSGVDEGASEGVMAIFRDAKDEADKGVGKLAGALRGTGEPALSRIADHGLTALNDANTYAKLVAALMDFDKAKGAAVEGAAKTLFDCTQAYRDAVMNDEMVSHWEANPLGIPVDIRAPMARALDQIDASARALL